MLNKTYKVLGLMSGSSLDGLDISYASYNVTKNNCTWNLIKAETIPFSAQWIRRLKNLPQQDALIFVKTHTYLGHYIGELVNAFIANNQIKPDFIASHGHTIFHYPNAKVTSQIGDGAAIAAVTGYPVISDFRTQDIALNGEGTPLAPTADKYLFKGYDFYLNLGGIANISANINHKWVAFDTSPCNQVLNMLANQLDLDYDKDGLLAKQGEIQEDILKVLATEDYFKIPYPKSLDNNWIRERIFPMFALHDSSIEDKLRTSCHHIALCIYNEIKQIIEKENFKKTKYKILVSGGGALNTFLIECIQKACPFVEVVVPNKDIIDYKEALLMGLLGVLRASNQPNCMATVTGADRDTIGGAIYQGHLKQL